MTGSSRDGWNRNLRRFYCALLRCTTVESRIDPGQFFLKRTMSNPARRTAFFISGSTGITAETLGHSLLTQFPDAKVHGVRLPFVTDRERAQDCARQIRAAAEPDCVRPIVFSTLVDPQIIDALRVADALYIDLFDQFIGPLESELQMQASHIAGLSHGITSSGNYQARIEAINYAMAHDDGVSSDNGLDAADVILVGVSRSGKTPTSRSEERRVGKEGRQR